MGLSYAPLLLSSLQHLVSVTLINSCACYPTFTSSIITFIIFQSAAAAPSPVLGNLPPGEGMPVGPVPPGFFQVWSRCRI